MYGNHGCTPQSESAIQTFQLLWVSPYGAFDRHWQWQAPRSWAVTLTPIVLMGDLASETTILG